MLPRIPHPLTCPGESSSGSSSSSGSFFDTSRSLATLFATSSSSKMRTFAITALTLLMTNVLARPEPPVGGQYLPPSQQYQRPGQGGFNNNFQQDGGFNNQYLPPAQQYGAPQQQFGASNSQYGAPGGGYGDYDTPARYEFEYSVNDAESGNDFGHKESRDGDVARGVYYVLLPDGRRQTVEYEADSNGFRPRITYTQEGPGIGSRNGYGNNGYSNGYNNGYRY